MSPDIQLSENCMCLQLYEVSRLRSLSSLSELSISGNPASSLQHSRLFLLYHLRTLDRLNDLPITQEERGHTHQRFSTGTSFHIAQTHQIKSDETLLLSSPLLFVIRGTGASAAPGGQQPIRAQQAAEGAAGRSDSTPPTGGDKSSTEGLARDTATHTHTAGARATHQESAGRTLHLTDSRGRC